MGLLLPVKLALFPGRPMPRRVGIPLLLVDVSNALGGPVDALAAAAATAGLEAVEAQAAAAQTDVAVVEALAAVRALTGGEQENAAISDTLNVGSTAGPGTSLFVTSTTSPAKVYKFADYMALSSPSTLAYSAISGNYLECRSLVYDATTGFVYASFDPTQDVSDNSFATVSKIDPATFTAADLFTAQPVGGAGVISTGSRICTDGTYVYLVTRSAFELAWVHRFRLSDGVQVASRQLAATYAKSANSIQQDGTNVYVTGRSTNHSWVARLPLDLSADTEIDLANNASPNDGYNYFVGAEIWMPTLDGKDFWKVAKDFSTSSLVSVGAAAAMPEIVYDGTYMLGIAAGSVYVYDVAGSKLVEVAPIDVSHLVYGRSVAAGLIVVWEQQATSHIVRLAYPTSFVNVESQAPAASSTGSEPVDAPAGVAQTNVEPIEAIAVATTPVSQTVAVPIEALAAAAATAADPVESVAPASATSTVPVEAQQPVVQTGVVPAESVAPVSATSAVPFEALRQIVQTDVAQLDAQAFAAATTAAAVEALAAAAATAVDPVDAIAAVRATAALVWSALAGVSQTDVLPIEALGVAVTAVSQIAVLPIDAQQPAASTELVRLDAAAAVAGTVVAVVEALAAAVAAGADPLEAVAAVASTELVRLDTAGAVAAARSVPVDGLAAVAQTVVAAIEASSLAAIAGFALLSAIAAAAAQLVGEPAAAAQLDVAPAARAVVAD